MSQLVSPAQVARAIGVSESSLKRWCDEGRLTATRTAGGHRRIAVDAVVRFVRNSGHRLVDPDILGLPATGGRGQRTIHRQRRILMDAFRDGHADAATRSLLDLYLAGVPLAAVFDDVVRPVLAEIGESWADGELEVYEERRGVEFLTHTMFELGRIMRQPDGPAAPLAVGGTLRDDPYTLAPQMVNLTLRECGYRSMYLGCGLPLETFPRAARNERPDLVWVCLSAAGLDEDAIVAGCRELHAACDEVGGRLVVGGRSVTDSLRERLAIHAFCEDMSDLSEVASGYANSTAGEKGDSGERP